MNVQNLFDIFLEIKTFKMYGTVKFHFLELLSIDLQNKLHA